MFGFGIYEGEEGISIRFRWRELQGRVDHKQGMKQEEEVGNFVEGEMRESCSVKRIIPE